MKGKPGELERALNEFDIGWTLLRSASSPAVALDRMPGWQRIYADDTTVIHRRERAARQ